MKKQKKENFVNRALMVSLSPVMLTAVLLASPIAAVRSGLSKKEAGVKESVKAALRDL